MSRGLFVVFEGGDRVGKSTQVARLIDHLTGTGYDVVGTFEPGDTPAGASIRRLVLSPETGDLDPRAEALLYAADKAQHVQEVIRPALARGAVVVCDRYVDSTLAYQGAGRVLEIGEVEQVARWATTYLRADLTVLLDADPEQAVQILTDKDRLEDAGAAFHQRVRAGFLRLAGTDPDRYLIIDARRERDEIAAEIAARVEALLAARDHHGPLDDVPATDVPATDVPATDVPATDVPATGTPSMSPSQAMLDHDR